MGHLHRPVCPTSRQLIESKLRQITYGAIGALCQFMAVAALLREDSIPGDLGWVREFARISTRFNTRPIIRSLFFLIALFVRTAQRPVLTLNCIRVAEFTIDLHLRPPRITIRATKLNRFRF